METTNSRKRIIYSLLLPSLFLLVAWIIKGYEEYYEVSFSQYGLYPRTFHGLLGIITCPFLHGDIQHLVANSIPFVVLSLIIFNVYNQIAGQIYTWIYLTTGFWVWVAAGKGYHIGASGVIYGLQGFLVFSGIFRRDPKLLAISLLIVFLYGSAIWGILPLQKNVSWESHLLGAIAGMIVAYSFRKEGPQPPVYDLEYKEEIEPLELDHTTEDIPYEDVTNQHTTLHEQEPLEIKIHYVATKDKTK